MGRNGSADLGVPAPPTDISESASKIAAFVSLILVRNDVHEQESIFSVPRRTPKAAPCCCSTSGLYANLVLYFSWTTRLARRTREFCTMSWLRASGLSREFSLSCCKIRRRSAKCNENSRTQSQTHDIYWAEMTRSRSFTRTERPMMDYQLGTHILDKRARKLLPSKSARRNHLACNLLTGKILSKPYRNNHVQSSSRCYRPDC
jgi:hypothetical protein